MPNSSDPPGATPETPHTHARFSARTTTLIALCVLGLLFLMGANQAQTVQPTVQPTGTLQALTPQPTATLAAEEVGSEVVTTTGLILGAVLLLMIIIIGTLAVIRREKK